MKIEGKKVRRFESEKVRHEMSLQEAEMGENCTWWEA